MTMVPVEQQSLSARRTISVASVARVFLYRMWLIGFIAACSAILFFMISRKSPPSYVASGNLIVDLRAFAIPELQGAIANQSSPDPLPSVRTEAIELQSPALLEQVVRALQLDTNKLVNPRLREPGILAQAGAWLQKMSPIFTPVEHQGPETDVAQTAFALSKLLTTFYDNRSLVVTVSATLPDAALAADVVNTVMRIHLQDGAHQREAENEAANTALMQRIDVVRKQVEELDQRLTTARAQSGLINLPAGSVAQQRMSELTTAANQARDDLQKAENAAQQANALVAAGRADQLSDVLASPTISRLREREAVEAARVADLSAAFGSEYPPLRRAQSDLQRLRAEIASEVGRMVRSLQTQVSDARTREANALQALSSASVDAGNVSVLQSQISQIEREIALRRALYQALLQAASSTASQPSADKHSPGVRVGSPAVVPVEPVAPRPKIAAVVGGLGGFFLGCVVALFGGIGPRFQSPVEVAALLDLPLLAVASAKLLRGRGNARMSDAKLDNALGSLHLRLRQLAIQSRVEIRIVNFVAGDAGESFISAKRFAQYAAQAGERVLLIVLPGTNGRQPAKAREKHGGLSIFNSKAVIQYDPGSSMAILQADQVLMDRNDVQAVEELRSCIREVAADYNLVVMASDEASGSALRGRLSELADYVVVIVDISRAKWSSLAPRVEQLQLSFRHVGMLALTRHRQSGASLLRFSRLSSNL